MMNSPLLGASPYFSGCVAVATDTSVTTPEPRLFFTVSDLPIGFGGEAGAALDVVEEASAVAAEPPADEHAPAASATPATRLDTRTRRDTGRDTKSPSNRERENAVDI